MVEFIM